MRDRWMVLGLALLTAQCGSTFDDLGKSAAQAVTCNLRRGTVLAYVDAVREDFDACQTDADCVAIDVVLESESGVCLMSCGGISHSSESEFLGAVSGNALVAEGCEGMMANGCPNVGRACEGGAYCLPTGVCGPSFILPEEA